MKKKKEVVDAKLFRVALAYLEMKLCTVKNCEACRSERSFIKRHKGK